MIFHIGAHELMGKIVMETKEKVIIVIVHHKAIVAPANMIPSINKEN